MRKYFKNSIVLSIVPVFVLAGCSSNEDQARLAVPNNESEVVVNQDGSYTQQDQSNAEKLLASYDEAKAKGFTGSLDDWIGLVQLHETNPELAQSKAEESGFGGGEMLLGALAGAAAGAMLTNAANSRANMANNAYSAQRYNSANNYAYSRPKDEERQNSGTGYYGRNTAGTTAAIAATAGATNMRSSNAMTTPDNTTSRSTYSSSNTTASSYSTSRPTASYNSVSRGGFGGAVSSGG